MKTIYRAPYAQVSFEKAKPYGKKLYNIKVDNWWNRFYDPGKEPDKTLPGDLLVLANAKPETISDSQRVGRSWDFGSVTKVSETENKDTTSLYFKVKASKDLEVVKSTTPLFMVLLVNLIPKGRIWKALHMSKNLDIIKEVLCAESMAQKNLCSEENNDIVNKGLDQSSSSGLNESQTGTLLGCLEMLHSREKSALELFWGPHSAGKTKTIDTPLLTLLQMYCRTLVCAATNVAITEIDSRVVKMVTEVESNSLYCSLAEVLLCGNKDRLKVGSDVEEIYLDYRLKRLVECLGLQTVSRHCFTPMIYCLEDGVSHYCTSLETELIFKKEQKTIRQVKAEESRIVTKVDYDKCKALFQFIRDRFVSSASSHRYCLSIFCTHMAKNHISVNNIQNMVLLINLVDSFESLFCQEWVDSNQNLSIGVVFPYAAQVIAIENKLGQKYNNLEGSTVKKKTVDRFQGGEEVVVIFSTVQSHCKQSSEFISKPQRVIVALTRNRHCLWILGNERTLCDSESVWETLVLEAENCLSFFNVDQDKDLAKAILQVKQQFGQLDALLSSNSVLFKSSRWKVLFSGNFLKLCKKLMSVSWMRLALKDLRYIQELKIWDILPIEDVSALVNHVDSILNKYTYEYLTLCNENCLEGFASDRSHSTETSLIDMIDFNEDEAQFNILKDSFHEVPPHNYSLFITLLKVLIMLDGTLGTSYFERLLDAAEVTHGQVRSPRSIALQTIIRTDEVRYENLSSLYWPHLDNELTKKLDVSRVFTEIISHTKGGLGAIEACDGEVSRDDYVAGDYSTCKGLEFQYIMGSQHGTTILWVQLPTEVLIAVDSQRTVEYIADDLNHHRKFEKLESEVDGKFIQIVPGAYATLCGDMKRCWKMVFSIRTEMEQQYKTTGIGSTLADIGYEACRYFRRNPMDPEKEKESTIFICSWMPKLETYHIIVVGDHYAAPVQIRRKVFGSGSGCARALEELMNFEAPIDATVLQGKMIEATMGGPYTGGTLNVWSLSGGTHKIKYTGKLIDELNKPVYEDMLFNGKSMFLITERRYDQILTRTDLHIYLSSFGTGVADNDIHWLCFPDGFVVYVVKLSEREYCDNWFGSCQVYKEPVRHQLFTNTDGVSCDYYLTYASNEILGRVRTMVSIDDLADRED